MDAIIPTKDIDGFNSVNIGELSKRDGNPFFVPCTANGILYLIKHALTLLGNDTKGHESLLSGKTVVVIGRSDIVGMPVAQLMLKNDATVVICHSKTSNLAQLTSLADILIVAIGQAQFIPAQWIRPGAIVIDVGINVTKDNDGRMVGDVQYEGMLERASAITPVPGGVGPLTVAMLMDNVITSAERICQNK